MQPPLWQPPIEPSTLEQTVLKRIKRAKLFVFLRQIRHELFSVEFQAELNQIYEESAYGHPPIPPAQIALAILLQAYTGASDDEAIEAMVMDRRWQLVLDCLDQEEAPFSKATLVRCRHALIRRRLDRRLIERTVELAGERGGFGARQLRAALDSSPLWGAGKVEDTYNLLGHALKKALRVIAAQQGWELAAVAKAAGGELLQGSSLKAALDLNWDDTQERHVALTMVLRVLESVQTWVEQQSAQVQTPAVKASLKAAHQIQQQDVETTTDGTRQLAKRVARNRRISVEDPHMRHGRKSRRQRVDGYKRHVLKDLDTGLVRCVGVTPANVPEAWVSDAIASDLNAQSVTLSELHIDRGYLVSKLVRNAAPTLHIYCKAWPVHNRNGLFPKTAFILDWQTHQIQCPNHLQLSFHPGSTVRFPAQQCNRCPLKERCTASSQGRSINIHPDEQLLQELRQRQITPSGRAKLRERITVEHSLAHIAHWQGERARYRTLRKNLFDLRRMAVIHNLHVLARLEGATQLSSAG